MAAIHDTCAAAGRPHMSKPAGEMASCQSKSSIHKRFVAGFGRHTSGGLIHCFGPYPSRITSVWPQIRDRVVRDCNLHSRLWKTDLPIKCITKTVESHGSSPCSNEYVVFEMPKRAEQQVFGLVLAHDSGAPAEQSLELDMFFADLVLSGMRVDIKTYRNILPKADSDVATDSIVHLFDQNLRYVAKYDKWLRGGREVFRQQVSSFTSRGARVEFCLPAFPCKSSSTDKVLSPSPDRGEHVALSNLQRFMQKIEGIYKPGAKLWIISDGHVFSDCIGVDDEVVDQYGAELQAMNKTVADRLGGKDRIGFRSLPDLFDYDSLVSPRQLPLVRDHLPAKPHLIATKTTVKAELCRHILNVGFRPGTTEPIEGLIASDPALRALYRGFSKFMLEDLATNKYTSHLSRSQLRKKASEVAKEMIQRNQAYSNLVEMMFPHHVRLSIHAHDNSGPKFGIKMLGKHVIPTDVVPPAGSALDCCDHLHIPTPWHNCMVEIDGLFSLYTTKASAVWPAVRSGDATWVNDGECGGYVHFKKLETVS